MRQLVEALEWPEQLTLEVTVGWLEQPTQVITILQQKLAAAVRQLVAGLEWPEQLTLEVTVGWLEQLTQEVTIPQQLAAAVRQLVALDWL